MKRLLEKEDQLLNGVFQMFNNKKPDNPGNNTFMKITNRMIYDEILLLKNQLNEMKPRITFNRWAIYVLLLLFLTMLGLKFV